MLSDQMVKVSGSKVNHTQEAIRLVLTFAHKTTNSQNSPIMWHTLIFNMVFKSTTVLFQEEINVYLLFMIQPMLLIHTGKTL
jgi:hypothetical protein